jgi:hypothetical protein
VVTDINGCTAEESITINVRKINDITFPNIISVDGNNMNGWFYPIGDELNILFIEELLIFDRWGNKVFANKNFLPNQSQEGWDGSFSGKSVTPGVFVYVAKVKYADEKIITYKGDITVIR